MSEFVYLKVSKDDLDTILGVMDFAHLAVEVVDSIKADWIPVSTPPTKNGRCMVVVSWPSGRSLVDTRIYLKEMGGFVGGLGEVVLWQPYPVLPGVTVPEVQS